MATLDDRIVFEKSEFDYLNPEAEVVIVGITPGNSQMKKSREGMGPREIKRINAFGGGMRPNIIAMLDHIGVNKLLGIESCSTLWVEDFFRVHMTSLLKDATYEITKNGKQMFKDVRKIAKSEKLTDMVNKGFVEECKQLQKARLFIACGPGVLEVLERLQSQGIINAPIVAIAHPSGANAGRIAAYLGKTDLWPVEQSQRAKSTIAEML